MTGEGHGMAVVGAGLVGSLTALLLANRGHHVDVYERRQDPRKVGDVAGRSINLALSERGWRALEKAGALEAVREIAMLVKARCMHGLDGGLTYQPYGLPGKGDSATMSASTAWPAAPLNRILLEAAEATGRVDVHFEHRLEDFSVSQDAVSLAFEGRSHLHHDRLFGTDGAFSAVRQRMMKGDRFDFSQSYLAHGYKEIAMPPQEDGGFAIDPEALHIWPRGHFMLMALPNPDRTFTCTLFAPSGRAGWLLRRFPMCLPGPASFRGPFPRCARPGARLRPGLGIQPDELPHHHAVQSPARGRPSSRWETRPTRSSPYGQGMNSGFEDARVLADLLDDHDGHPSDEAWTALMADFTRLRKANGDAIGDLALRNFIEMRDRTGDPRFLLAEAHRTPAHRPPSRPLGAALLHGHLHAPSLCRGPRTWPHPRRHHGGGDGPPGHRHRLGRQRGGTSRARTGRRTAAPIPHGMKRLEHIGIAVSDLEEAERIFGEILGSPAYKREEVAGESVLTSFFRTGDPRWSCWFLNILDSAIAKHLEKWDRACTTWPST